MHLDLSGKKASDRKTVGVARSALGHSDKLHGGYLQLGIVWTVIVEA